AQVMEFITKLYELDRMADIIIIDTGAGISDSVMELVVASREILLVATPEPTSITDAYALLKTLNRRGGFDQSNVSIKMIGNRVHRYEDGIELFEKLGVVVKKFLGIEFSLLGLVPYDDKCQKSVMKQSPVSLEYPNAAASKAYENIAYKLNFASGDSDEAKKTRGIRSLFSNVVKMKYRK
ncbi:MAG: MinD/ParA family protein, partial [Lachnospiraceae bacterium]|nr:MinD/ParA family protein [Lachnospiraceae bacterium]